MEFVNVPKLPPNASLDDSFVVLAPELALRARRGGGSRDLPSTSPGAASTARSLTVPGKGTTPMADSFVVLPNERAGGDELDANVMARVFDIASDLSDSDHPLCAECSAALLAEVERRTAEAEAECAAYEEALERLQSAEDDEYAARGDDATSEGEGIALTMQNVEKSQREADETLRALESELASTRLARNKLAKKAAALDEAEDTYWREFHAFKKNLNAHMEKRDAIVARTEQAQMHMERLEKTNVFNDAFHIWTDGAFGTINGFRLGRLPNVVVEWDEINAAFGLACLLLQSMARICKFTFTQYTLKPMGSFPKVYDARGNVFELFGPVSIISSHKYDKAVLGFLTCMHELSEFMRARDVRQGVNPPFELPFAISSDKVDGKKMSFTFNRDENWTYALKLMLTDLKLMLAWLSCKD